MIAPIASQAENSINSSVPAKPRNSRYLTLDKWRVCVKRLVLNRRRNLMLSGTLCSCENERGFAPTFSADGVTSVHGRGKSVRGKGENCSQFSPCSLYPRCVDLLSLHRSLLASRSSFLLEEKDKSHSPYST